MMLLSGLVFWFALASFPQAADSCQAIVSELQLPARVKARGKPKRIRWEQANAMMPRLRQSLQGRGCRLTFQEVFAPKREDVFFPLLDSLLRTVPEGELEGVPVYYLDGEEAGRFSNRVIFEKSSYSQYYFQYKGKDGDLRTSNKNLLDFADGKPTFLMRWQDIKGKVVVSGSP